MNKLKTKIIVACCENNGIGFKNTLPWNKIKDDINYFKNTTIGNFEMNEINIVVMGYNTWKSIPEKFRPLKNRINIILSSKHYNEFENPFYSNTYYNLFDFINKNICVKSWDELENLIKKIEYIGKQNQTKDNLKLGTTWIIGGSSIYNLAFEKSFVTEIHITNIPKEYECDCYFTIPVEWNKNSIKIKQIEKTECSISIYSNNTYLS